MSHSRLSIFVRCASVLALASTVGCSSGASGGGGDGGGGDSNESVEVSFPGSTVIYEGESFADAATVPSDALVGVVRDGQAYLYHPALGDADLSDETSRRAVGAFLVGLDDDRAASGVSKLAPRELSIGFSTTLDTGVRVKRTAANEYEITNPKKRWVAIKRGAVDPPVFLPPRKSPVTTSVYGLADLIAGDFHLTTTASVRVNSEALETFGAVTRGIWLISFPILGNQIIDKARDALDLKQAYHSGLLAA